jgi:hypothetical protein
LETIMAVHAPITGAPTRAPSSRLEPQFALFNRATIEAEIERLIGVLDACDGDPDLEDDDHSGDEIDQRGEAPTDSGQPLATIKPSYRVDQRRGPTNERAAYRAWHAEMMR